MKKFISILLSLVIILNCGVAMAAQTTTVKEDKTAKVIINGVAFKNSNVLLLQNGTPMLSTDYFTALGISTKNQVWDKSKKKLTLTKEKSKLTLELNSSNYTLNGKKYLINVKPFSYKGKPYFPAELVATSFGNIFIPDAETNTYFIKNKTDFTKNKVLLDNILKSMNSISKIKINENVKFDLNGIGVKLNLIAPAATLTDRKSGLAVSNMMYKQTTNGELQESKIQMALIDNSQYIQVDGGEWMRQEFTDKEFAAQFDFDGMFKYDDVICSALNTINGAKNDEIVIKGNIIMGVAIPQFLNGQGLNNTTLNTKSIEITLNKKTNIVSKIVLKVTGTTIIDKLKYNISLNYEIKYSDINGKFEVVIPDELK